MSRIGKKPVSVPKGVRVSVSDSRVNVEGPKGRLSQALPPGISCRVDGEWLHLGRADDSKPQKALHGLSRSLLANAVRGVTSGFTRELEIEGIGYRAQLQGQELTLALGFSHPVVYRIPEGVRIGVDKQVRITITGADKQQVGQVAAEIRALRPPEPYKGKGVRYAGEHVKRKVGKTGA